MKRALEAVLVVAALALGAYVVRQGLARRALAEHPPVAHPGYAPGPDVANSANPADAAAPQPGSVQGLPMLKLSRPPKPTRDEPDVPPPAP